MGTRPGSLDPGVLLYLVRALHLSIEDVETMLYRKSGLLGISGISSDMRELESSTDPFARVWVIPTNEELTIARHTGALLKL